ncbi:A disintegrin and metalloproteinase with thrombospondin motifs adt-1 [Hydra vulgaris]|uniref:A disintegrin and metalloproteinase with thrombospondin motifs adt-1 n=1 Tax=Hydra vulgaris TaxID=6087 RepID=UPI0032EA5EDF
MKILHLSFTEKSKIFILILWMIVSVYCLKQTVTIPERQSDNIQCPLNALITVLNAEYKASYCNCINTTTNMFNCSKNVTNYIQSLCDKKNNCVVHSNNDIFGDPCIGMSKDTSITYICHLENSIFVQELKNNYTIIELNDFYDEFMVSFVILSNEKPTSSIISIEDKNNNHALKFNITDLSLMISTVNNSYIVNITPNTSSTIVITQYFINRSNAYNISVAVNETVRFSDINTNPMILSDSVLYIFLYCSFDHSCNFGFIKNLSLYSKTQVIWSFWSEWSFCDTHCMTNRSRNCNNNQWVNCIGNSFKTESCTSLDKDFWTPWNVWLHCNVSYGIMNRSRECCVSNNLDLCYDITSQLLEYSVFWAQWSDWSHCNSSNGYSNRTRECIDLEWCYVNQSELLEYSEYFIIEKETLLSKGNLITKIKKLSKEYSVSFEINLTSINDQFRNIIHMTVETDMSNYGDRIPGVWTYPGKSSLHICAAVNNNTNYCLHETSSLNLSSWSSLKISQELLEGKYFYSIQLNKEKIFIVVNEVPQEFSNVKVYISDPWYDVQPGYIRNVKITNGSPALLAKVNINSTCSTFYGIMNKSSNCKKKCDGHNFELTNCIIYWAQWSNWTSCNASQGNMMRTRRCIRFNTRDQCSGNSYEVQECYVFWSQWSNYSSCDSTKGYMNRTRECNTSDPINQCLGNSTEVKECYGKIKY